MRGTYKNPTEDALGIGSDLASPAPGGTGASPAPGGTGPTQFRLYERTYPPEGGERRSPKGIVRSHSKGPVRVASDATLTGPFDPVRGAPSLFASTIKLADYPP